MTYTEMPKEIWAGAHDILDLSDGGEWLPRECDWDNNIMPAKYILANYETTAYRLLRHIFAENSALRLPDVLSDDELDLIKELRG